MTRLEQIKARVEDCHRRNGEAMNRIDEFANAFQGWMAEWESSRKSGKYSQKGGCPDVGVSALPSDAKGSPRLVQEEPEPTMDDGYLDEEPYWNDSLTTLERYGRGGK